MPTLTLRLTEEQHEKLRWLAYTEKRSQHAILIEMVEKVITNVELPPTPGGEDQQHE